MSKGTRKWVLVWLVLNVIGYLAGTYFGNDMTNAGGLGILLFILMLSLLLLIDSTDRKDSQ